MSLPLCSSVVSLKPLVMSRVWTSGLSLSLSQALLSLSLSLSEVVVQASNEEAER
jgi:hypothetical protein